MFKLIRYLPALYFLLVGFFFGLLVLYFHHASVDPLLHHEQVRSEAITRGLKNSFGSDFRSILHNADKRSINDLQERAYRSQLREALANRLRNTTVLKIKLFTLQGLSAFSTDIKQIGENKSATRDFCRPARAPPSAC